MLSRRDLFKNTILGAVAAAIGFRGKQVQAIPKKPKPVLPTKPPKMKGRPPGRRPKGQGLWIYEKGGWKHKALICDWEAEFYRDYNTFCEADKIVYLPIEPANIDITIGCFPKEDLTRQLCGENKWFLMNEHTGIRFMFKGFVHGVSTYTGYRDEYPIRTNLRIKGCNAHFLQV